MTADGSQPLSKLRSPKSFSEMLVDFRRDRCVSTVAAPVFPLDLTRLELANLVVVVE